jgi:hypothetical protein
MIERYKGILTRLEDNGIQTLGELCIYDRDGYLDVVNSGKTMSQFLNIMDNNELLLTIKTI